jgi:hypothetical protein
VLDRRDRLTGCILVLLHGPVAHQLVTGACILSFAQPGKFLGSYRAMQAINLSELAMPLTLNSVALFPIVLFGRSEFLRVIGLRLASTERFRYREHERSLSPDMQCGRLRVPGFLRPWCRLFG